MTPLVIISIVLPIISPVIYIRSMLKGIAKPERMTRFVVLVITIVSFLSLIAQNNREVIGLAFISMVQAVVIFGFSLRYGMGGKTKLDLLCLGIAGLGIALWQVSGNPLAALYASLFADLVGYLPALIKTYNLPHTEDWRFYAIDAAAGGAAILAVANWNPETVAYPLYIILINLVMFGLVAKGYIRTRTNPA